ncbi:MAG TPA: glycine oxidase ThiO [Terriglobales bacterium]|nr:glycine oxidase ThiO [Terriglobales bacterium]
MKSADAIILGAGIIGLSLALELRRNGLKVLVLERQEPGREASHAAAGMLAPSGGDLPDALATLAHASARIYREFVMEIEDAAGMKADLRSQGTLLIGAEAAVLSGSSPLSAEEQLRLEPAMTPQAEACFLAESSVDPRALCSAATKAALHHGVEIASGTEVLRVEREGESLAVVSAKTTYRAAAVVNCCGAWAGQVAPLALPTRPFKGQMLSLVPEPKHLLAHVIRAEHVYLVPRSSGLILVGATIEDIGFDKRIDRATIDWMRQAAVALVPELGRARTHEAWAGLRPGTPDDLPILGESGIPGYFFATGHFRNGILLAPVTAQVMTQLILKQPISYDLAPFSPARFAE